MANLYKKEEQMKIYAAPIVEIHVLTGCDVVTASDPFDNNFGDIDNWED